MKKLLSSTCYDCVFMYKQEPGCDEHDFISAASMHAHAHHAEVLITLIVMSAACQPGYQLIFRTSSPL